MNLSTVRAGADRQSNRIGGQFGTVEPVAGCAGDPASWRICRDLSQPRRGKSGFHTWRYPG